MNVTVIGTGYVGLVSGTCFAEVGNNVVCLDLDPEKIRILNSGGIPIFEPHLLDMIKRNVEAGRLKFTTDIEAAVDHAAIQFIAVGTPPDEDGSADLQYVLAAARNIAKYMKDFKVIVDKSTVPVGTATQVSDAIAKVISERKVAHQYAVVSNPEFLKEGAAIDDFMRPDRIIIGVENEQALELMRELYSPFQRNHERLIVMNVKSAELTKYAANAMLATRISFMNELANLAEELGADIESVRLGMGSDPRIGYHFLYPGCGYGGSCFPKDVKALISTAKARGLGLKVLDAVEAVNDLQKHVLFKKMTQKFGSDLKGKHFAIWGLSFKPNTDDMREAPSRALIGDLFAAGATVSVYDPVAMHEAQRIYANAKGIQFSTSPLASLDGADALAIVTEWKEFRSPDFLAIKAKLKTPVVFDGRNLYDPAVLSELGIEYFAVGRGVH